MDDGPIDLELWSYMAAFVGCILLSMVKNIYDLFELILLTIVITDFVP